MQKKKIFLILLVTLFLTTGVGATSLYYSNQVQYNNIKSSVTDVKGALDELYANTNNTNNFVLYITYRSNTVSEVVIPLYEHPDGNINIIKNSNIIKLEGNTIVFNKDCKISLSGLISTYSTTPYFNIYVNSKKISTFSGDIRTELEMKSGDILQLKSYNATSMWYFTAVTITNI